MESLTLGSNNHEDLPAPVLHDSINPWTAGGVGWLDPSQHGYVQHFDGVHDMNFTQSTTSGFDQTSDNDELPDADSLPTQDDTDDSSSSDIADANHDICYGMVSLVLISMLANNTLQECIC